MNGRIVRRISLLLLLFIINVIPVGVQAATSKKAPQVNSKVFFTSVKLSWDKRKNLDGYEIYQTSASGSGKTLVSITKDNKFYIKNLKSGTKYYYCVRGYKKYAAKTEYTNYSKVITVTMPKYKQNSTIKKLLQTALKPVGRTLYVWGGGWNKADNGAGKAARTLGVSSKWYTFYKKQDSSYDYNNTRYQIENGLDCSGYVGWVIYNTFETKNNQKGYVMYAQNMAKNFADRGWGKYIKKSKVKDWKAGDIMSSSGHVYIVVGECSDGSVVLLHSSPPGVFLCGTATKTGKSSQAQRLARKYMKQYYPGYYKRYPDVTRGSSYLKDYNQMRWSVTGNIVMTDPDGYTKMSATQVLADLFR